MAYTHERRLTTGRVRGLTTRAFNDPLEYTAKARSTFRASFDQQVDPEGVLELEEREKRATALYRAHMTRLSVRSAQVRAQRRAKATS